MSKTYTVSLYHNSQEIEYTSGLSIEETKEFLGRKMVNGYRYSLPAWLYPFGSKARVEVLQDLGGVVFCRRD